MILIPPGECIVGGAPDNPQANIYIDAFFIDKYEVSNRMFKKFIEATNYPILPANWRIGTFPKNEGDFPVTYVTLNDALAYARWQKKRLPTENEWEKAARGMDGRPWPWGVKWKRGYANIESSGPANIGAFSRGKSPHGVLDLTGNVWEWTQTKFDPPASSNKLIPSGLQSFHQQDIPRFILKGGSWLDQSDGSETYARRICKATSYFITYGFRCACDARKLNE